MAKKLKKNYLVIKQNAVNEMRTNNMNLQELRFFSIYLSKIDPQNQETRVVRFPLADFQAIMELGRMNMDYFKKVAKNLLNKPVEIPTERGGFEIFQIFQVFVVDPDDNGDWYVEIDTSDRALPLLFDFKAKYFKYELWNALGLKSKNQLRMYEVLKQHEGVGHRVISVDHLKEMLGIGLNEYSQYNDFKRYVLDVCQKALSGSTDISFDYEVHSKKSRKIRELKFTIRKNENYKSPLNLEKFID